MDRIRPIRMDSNRRIFILFSLASAVVQGYGELVMQYDPSEWKMNLTCLAKDDSSSALVWIHWYGRSSPFPDISDFVPKRPALGNVSACGVRSSSACLAGWDDTTGWKVVNSADRPTGPVSDHRWEDFPQFKSDAYVSEVKSFPVAIWISARGSDAGTIYLCEKRDPELGPCIRISIASLYRESVSIKSCTRNRWPRESEVSESCSDVEVSTMRNKLATRISHVEWRTFRIDWRSESKTVAIFHSDGSEACVSETIPIQDNVSHVLMAIGEPTSAPSYIRFHFYDYYFTEAKSAVITTRGFDHSGRIFRAELLVGVCRECGLIVNLVDGNNSDIETWTFSGDQRDSGDGLLAWQLVKLNATFDGDGRRFLKVEIETTLVGDGGRGQWAIDNIRIYESGWQWRRSIVTTIYTDGGISYCRKMSYSAINEVVRYPSPRISDHTAKVELKEFLSQKYEEDFDQRGKICNRRACICTRGFTGDDCTDDCHGGFHGYDCEEECGFCKDSANCDAKTGFCPAGCGNDTIPPLCRTGSMGFAGELELEQDSEYSIRGRVPAIINVTKNTWATITVSGLTTCVNDHFGTRLSSIRRRSWVTESYKVGNNETREFFVSGPRYPDKKWNCSFHVGETYRIVVHIRDKTFPESWSEITSEVTLTLTLVDHSCLAWLTILPAIAVCLLVLYIWYRSSRRREVERSYLEILEPLPTDYSPDVHAWVDSTPQVEGQLEDQETTDHVYAVPNEPDSCSVSSESFGQYVRNGANGGLFDSQYVKLPVGLTKPCEYGSLPENLHKNRYENLIAYDHSRVILKKIYDDPYSDYINASHVKGYRRDRAYIATQAPMANTLNDFWRMIWQEDVRVICMLNGDNDYAPSCAQYWPETMTRSKYGGILISNIDERIFADFTFRTFKLCTKEDIRKVTHLHYTGWPSPGSPMYPQSLVAYLKRLRDIPARNGAVVVHCRNGDDRTGTVILADICIRQAAAEGVIDVVAAITRIRDDRANLVGTLQHYLLAHILIAGSLGQRPTQIPCTKKLVSRIKEMKMQLSSDIQRLEETMCHDRALQSFATVNPSTPEDLVEPSRSMENPIGAVIVDGVRVKGQYLASWLPTPLCLDQFWRFVVEKNAKLIIILQSSDPKDPSCRDIVPDEQTLLNTYQMEVHSEPNPDGDVHFKTDKILLTGVSSSEDDARLRSVTVLTCRGWQAGENGKLPATETLVSLWNASEKIPRKEGETLVLCHDGVTGCGLYLALSFMLERMAVERECDVFSAVRAVRRSRPEFVKTAKEFDYLYNAAVTYAQTFATYSNFT